MRQLNPRNVIWPRSMMPFFPSDGKLPYVNSNCASFYFISVSRSLCILLSPCHQRRDDGGVSTEEEVPGRRREENARHPVKEHVQDPTEGILFLKKCSLISKLKTG